MNNNKTNNNEQRLLLENRARRPCSTIVCKANLSRTVVSVPRPPARSRGIHSPLRRGGDGGGAVYLVAGGRGAETPSYVFFTKSGYFLCIVKEKIVNLPMLKMLFRYKNKTIMQE